MQIQSEYPAGDIQQFGTSPALLGRDLSHFAVVPLGFLSLAWRAPIFLADMVGLGLDVASGQDACCGVESVSGLGAWDDFVNFVFVAGAA